MWDNSKISIKPNATLLDSQAALPEVEKKDTCKSRAMAYLPGSIFSFWDASLYRNPMLWISVSMVVCKHWLLSQFTFEF